MGESVRYGEGAEEIELRRHFTRPDQDLYDSVKWELRTARIQGDDGEPVFEQENVEVPESWSPLATNIVASKYFRGHLGSPQREHSVRQLIGRVVKTLRDWGREGDYFASPEQEETFSDELSHLLLHQKACFNSPVEAMLFKGGAGTGTNLSSVRSSVETLAGGGIASGPVSFMRGFDSFAGVIRSGGKTRRAAKMVILNADHPDILDFVRCKAAEEQKAWALIDAGFDGRFNVPGGAYDSIQYQNANHSVRVSDGFLKAVAGDASWQTRAVTTGEVVHTYQARDVMREISDAAYV